MTKFNKILCGVFTVYLCAALPLAQAQNAPGPGAASPWHTGKHIHEIYNQLNLTDDQKKQLESNKQDHRAKMVIARQEMKADEEALRQELMNPQMDMSKINQIHDKIKLLQDQMEDEKLNSILAVRTILTPEQFSKFIDLMHKHREGHQK